MKNNRIPRTATALKVKFLIDTSGTKQGETVTVYKNDHGQAADGKHYYFFPSMLRNPEVCQIAVVA